MKLNVYALYDRIAGQFRSLSLDDKAEVAKRNLAFAVNNDSQLGFISKDLDLMKVGEFDSETGAILPRVPPETVCHAADLIGYEPGKEVYE